MGSTGTPVVPAVVIDSNVVGAWSFEEQDTAKAREVRDLIARGELRAIIPSLFWAEFQQICGKKMFDPGEGAPALSLEEVDQAYEDATRAPLEEIGGELTDLRDDAWQLRKRTMIGSYDAYYLALALVFDTDVWTFDRRFRDRANADSECPQRVKHIGTDVLG